MLLSIVSSIQPLDSYNTFHTVIHLPSVPIPPSKIVFLGELKTLTDFSRTEVWCLLQTKDRGILPLSCNLHGPNICEIPLSSTKKFYISSLLCWNVLLVSTRRWTRHTIQWTHKECFEGVLEKELRNKIVFRQISWSFHIRFLFMELFNTEIVWK